MPYNLRGREIDVYLFIKTEFDSVVAISSRAVTQDSTNFPNLLNLGIAYFNLDAYEEALGVLENAIQLSPKSAEARFYLGQTYYHLDEKRSRHFLVRINDVFIKTLKMNSIHPISSRFIL